MTEETEAKSILRTYKRIDSWFISRYGMNLYRGCVHDCVYCDGRAEKYQVEGEFGRDVCAKTNAAEILSRELDPSRKRKPFTPCYFMIGGGVGDSYQPAEAHYGLTRKALRLCLHYGHPVHLLTKSDLILRDIDLIKEIHHKAGAIASFSFSSVDEELSLLLEPGVPSPAARLDAMARIKAAGIPCGMFLLPVVPCVTDSPHLIDQSVRLAKEAGADFIIFGAMTLKEGRQKSHFFSAMKDRFPDLRGRYTHIHDLNRWGAPSQPYAEHVGRIFAESATRHAIPMRIPLRLFNSLLEQRERILVLLDHIDYHLQLKGQKTSFGYAAHLLSISPLPLHEAISGLRVSAKVREVITEIMETGSAGLYRELCGR